ncbi:MAG: LacI family DNA-binding transcriptional regulator [Halieaceae bacterium]|nr:LacI family DNA-binding transcriptional regulator [Halieaceae bacterium]
MSSIKDVAELAGVSIATVSRYLSDPESIRRDNREKVARAIQRTDYAPNALAQNFRRGRTGIIMVVLPSVGDPFFTEVMRGIAQVASERHYSILIRETEMNTLSLDEYSDIVLSKQADGIILLASTCPITPMRRRPKASRPAPIILGCENVTPDLGNLFSVRIDNRAAARKATRHLLELGHERIAFISGSAGSELTADRERGYVAAMKRAGKKIADGWIVPGQLTIDGARDATRALLQHPQAPTAIFCANDEMAMGCIHEIKQAGLRVPDDVSVIGFDDTRYAAITDPPLTTIAQPAELIGQRTMLRILDAVDGIDIGSEPEIVPHKLVLRASTGAPAS